jgi:hypothetical protein
MLDIIMPLGNTDTRCVEKFSFVVMSGWVGALEKKGEEDTWEEEGCMSSVLHETLFNSRRKIKRQISNIRTLLPFQFTCVHYANSTGYIP